MIYFLNVQLSCKRNAKPLKTTGINLRSWTLKDLISLFAAVKNEGSFSSQVIFFFFNSEHLWVTGVWAVSPEGGRPVEAGWGEVK